ncbi:VOC family protein [Methylomonas sp. EFPC3]|uniref:VOC family protein n=1 Tax=Methylomonas sp. EFPC3 TaxID=3021710 RepID=UPI002415B75E|nr:VOC family protein [Methylomonas sp. EFPC3]WFP49201.1 VOC family protein [Methylomonas sp. EFPC3]
MNSPVKPIPEGYQSVTPYLTVDDAAAALAFYQQAFGAVEIMRLLMPGDKIGHAEFTIGVSHFMISDEYPNAGSASPHKLGGTPVKLHMYLNDVDAGFAQAVAAGATPVMEPADQFWGDRMGVVTDPFGHQWMLATHVADVDGSEFQAKMDALVAAGGDCA